MSTTKVDVVIVGGGYSGLACAAELRRHGITSFVVLEATGRTGGRIRTDEEGTDLGGAFFGPGQLSMFRVFKELGIDTYDLGTEGDFLINVDDKVSRFNGNMPNQNPIVLLDVNSAIRQLEAVQATIDIADPRNTPDAAALDRITIAEYLQRLCWTRVGHQFLCVIMKTLLTTQATSTSALAALWYLRGAGGIAAILDGEWWKARGGAGTIGAKLTAKFTDHIHRNTPVRRIVRTDDGKAYDVCSDGGVSFRCRFIVVALPPAQATRIEFTPPLPPHRVHQLQRWPMSNVIKTFTYYKTRFWRDHGFIGRCLSSDDNGLCVECYDDSGAGAKTPCLLGFISADDAAVWLQRSPSERKAALAKHYARVFGDDAGLHPIGYKEMAWGGEPYVGGGYTALPLPGVLSTYGRSWRDPIDRRIFFASTEAANRWPGYMEGAFESGERAARNVAVGLGRLPEQEYERVVAPEDGLTDRYIHSASSMARPRLPTLEGVVAVGLLTVCIARWYLRAQ